MLTFEECLKALPESSDLVADDVSSLLRGACYHHLAGVLKVLDQQLSLRLLVQQGLQTNTSQSMKRSATNN